MANQLRDAENSAGPTASTPSWVKVIGAVVLLAILVFLVVLLTQSGHGPGQHVPPLASASAF